MIALCRSIFTRHRIAADRVLGHSDVAPTRKRDPGEKFPWKALADSGVGLWVKPAPIEPADSIFTLGDTNPAIEEAQTLLANYGYDVAATGYLDGATRDTDWYQINLAQRTRVTWKARGEFDVVCGILNTNGTAGCPVRPCRRTAGRPPSPPQRDRWSLPRTVRPWRAGKQRACHPVERPGG